MNISEVYKLKEECLQVLDLLSPDPHMKIIKDRIKKYVPDVRSILFYLAREKQPKRYLEVGVRTGISMCMVANQAKNCSIVGIDLWIPNYGNTANPGKDYVFSELNKVGFKGNCLLLYGDSHIELPKLSEPTDLILVDGDHSYEGALQDLRDCIKLLNGYLVFDDLQDEGLTKAWKQIQIEYPDFNYEIFGDVGLLWT